MKRTYWHCKTLDRYNRMGDVVKSDETNANLIGSKVNQGFIGNTLDKPLHAPVLDIDFEAKLVPSKTKGHYHLYLDKQMTWWRYKRLLKALYKAGIIERGYYKGSLNTKQTLVRVPEPNKTYNINIKQDLKPLHHIRLREISSMLQGLVQDSDPNLPKP